MKVKTKVSYSSNPNGNLWMKDDNGFGQKMLAKMGWSTGQGLGRANQGITKAISVIRKSDSRGVGCSKQWAEEGNAQMDAFADVLASLNSQGGETAADEETNVGLEETSKNCRFRLHYGKFTRGKDLSRHSDDVLKCIVGSRGIKTKDAKQGEQETESKTKEEPSGVQYVQSVVNMADYFKQKMAAKLSCLRTSESAPQLSTYDDEPSENELETRPSFGGAFTPSQDVSRSGFLTGGEKFLNPSVKFEVGSSDEESNKTKVKFEVTSSDEDSKKAKVKREVESSSDEGRPSFCLGDSNDEKRKISTLDTLDVKDEIDSQNSSDPEETERRRKREKKKKRKRKIRDESEEETKKSKKRRKSYKEDKSRETPVSSSVAEYDSSIIEASDEDIEDRKSKSKKRKKKRKTKEMSIDEDSPALPPSSQKVLEDTSSDTKDAVKKPKKSKRRKREDEAEVEEAAIEEGDSEDTQGEDTKKSKKRKRKEDVEREPEDSDAAQEEMAPSAFTPDVSEKNKEIWGHLDDTIFSTSNLKHVDGYPYYTLDLNR